MLTFLITGALLGLSAGLAPGPLLALVIAETLRHGVGSGIKVALAPIMTDAPIILLTLAILPKLSDLHLFLGLLSLAGAVFILSLGWRGLRSQGLRVDPAMTVPRSLTKGILTNALSPHPYVFWLSVGGPIMVKAMTMSIAAPLTFVTAFYALLVGSKIALALLVGRSRAFLSSRLYLGIMRALGLALVILAFMLLRESFEWLGLIAV